MKFRIIWLATIFFLYGCSSEEPTSEPQSELGDVATYTTGQLSALVEKGEDTLAARIITERAKRRLAGINDFILLANIFNARLDGNAAELALDQAKNLGATRGLLAIPLTKAFMLQQRFTEAKDELRLAQLTRSNGLEINILEGEIAQALGNADIARRYYDLAREVAPNNYRIDVSLALLEMSVGNFETAKELAHAAINKNSAGGDAKPHYALGAINRLEGNSQLAIPHLQRALDENQNDMLSQLELIGAYLDTQQVEKAETVLDSLIAVSPNNMLAQFYVAYILASKGENQQAEDVLLQSRDLLTKYRPAKRLYGHVAYSLEKFDAATNYLEQYLEFAPGDTETRLALADTHTRAQRPQEALKVLEPVLNAAANTIVPLTTEATNNDTNALQLPSGPVIEALARAGAALQSSGDIQSARQQYERAITLAASLDPADPTLVTSLTAVLASMEYNAGEREKGLALMTTAAASETATYQQLLTLANMQMLNNQLDAALATAVRLKADPEANNLAYNIVGSVEFRRGNFEASVEALTQALNNNPNYASARHNRAKAYIALARFDEALQDLLTLKPQADGNADFYGMLARTQLQLKNYVAAIDAYQTTLKLNPNSATHTANFASALGEKGRYAEAITQANAALKLVPDNKAFQEQLTQMIERFKAAAEEEARGGR